MQSIGKTFRPVRDVERGTAAVRAGDWLGGIDAGGTTFKCGSADAEGAIVARRRVPVTTPEATLAACADFFAEESARFGAPPTVLGVGCFGPLDLDPRSPAYGSILATPKAGWSGFPVRRAFADALNAAVAIETDVNAALLAEMRWGAAKGLDSAAYVTVGTGIGAGVFVQGGFLARPKHPEFGHIRVARHPDDAAFAGVCAFHGDCLEGLASAPAFAARHGDPERLGPDHAGWDIEAWYLAQACLALTLTCRLDRIILGGGLMLAPGLIDRVRAHFAALLNGYLDDAEPSSLIVTPKLGDDAGLRGAIALAMDEVAGRP